MTTQLFIEKLIQINRKTIINIHITGLLWGESASEHWTHSGSVIWKLFPFHEVIVRAFTVNVEYIIVRLLIEKVRHNQYL